jgi:hypothetical protein
MNELFNIPEVKSPRLVEWMDFHGIWTWRIGGEWMATGAIYKCQATTEQDAMEGVAKKMGIKLWNDQ